MKCKISSRTWHLHWQKNIIYLVQQKSQIKTTAKEILFNYIFYTGNKVTRLIVLLLLKKNQVSENTGGHRCNIKGTIITM